MDVTNILIIYILFKMLSVILIIQRQNLEMLKDM
jgi:hypothetical protein